MRENTIEISPTARMVEKTALFVDCQMTQIKKGGWRVVLRKTGTFVIKTVYFILALPLVGLIGVLRPWITVRLCSLDIGRIGGMLFADWYISERIASMTDCQTVDLFYLTSDNGKVCNRQWARMWKRVLPIVPCGRVMRMVDKVQRHVFHDHRHVIPHVNLNPQHGLSPEGLQNKLDRILACGQPHIRFTAAEEQTGQQALRVWGIAQATQWVCFHARDARYLKTQFPGRSWEYHDYRDSQISNYLPAVEDLATRGYKAVRMGAVVEEKLTTWNPSVIDYAAEGSRTDFLDIYLGAHCRFFICSDTGIATIPEIFRRPVLYVNWTPIARISQWGLKGIFIFKKFYLSSERRFMNFREIFESGLGNCSYGEEFKQRGIELHENIPDEITAAVLEMDDRLNGTWSPHPDDEELQRRFWVLFGDDKPRNPGVRIGAEYLRQNRDLLK